MSIRSFDCAAILFDLDGVLADSTQVVDRQWRLWARENGLDPDDLSHLAHGLRTVEVVSRFAPHLDPAAEVVKIEEREAADLDGVSVIPGALALIASLPLERWAVVTSGTRYLATTRLHHCRVPLPNVLVTADDVMRGKPHPEPYLKGAASLGFEPEQCLVFEDTPAGIESAHAAGMRAIALTTTYPRERLAGADAIIATLEGVRAVPTGNGYMRVEIK